jgi:hypothetical protein
MTVELSEEDLDRILGWFDTAANEGQFDGDDEALVERLVKIRDTGDKP